MWALVQEWLDTFTYKPPSQRELAPRLKVSNSTLGDYKYARSMPPPIFVVRLANEIQAPYEKVLDAVLKDRGYRGTRLAYAQASVNAEDGESSSDARPELDETPGGQRVG